MASPASADSPTRGSVLWSPFEVPCLVVVRPARLCGLQGRLLRKSGSHHGQRDPRGHRHRPRHPGRHERAGDLDDVSPDDRRSRGGSPPRAARSGARQRHFGLDSGHDVGVVRACRRCNAADHHGGDRRRCRTLGESRQPRYLNATVRGVGRTWGSLLRVDRSDQLVEIVPKPAHPAG